MRIFLEILLLMFLLSFSQVNGHLQYLIEWEDADGFGGERTWESASACSCPNAVKAFETGGGKKANSSASKGSR